MTSEEQVSIIIPVYNAELLLNNCIQSVINQTYRNIEVILINDGSTDNSGVICDEFANIDSRVLVSHESNAGPSISRNRGIELAQGKYIQFVDSDDTIELIMTEKLVESINDESQLVLSGYSTAYINSVSTSISQNNIPIEGNLSNEIFLENFVLLFQNFFINPVWNKLYKTEIIKGNNIRFIEYLDMGEDLLFNLDYLNYCKRICVINNTLYNYIIANNNKSLMNSYKENYFENQQLLFQKVKEYLNANSVSSENHHERMEEYFTNSVIGCINNLFLDNSNLTVHELKDQIHKIVFSKEVRKSLYYFKYGSSQKRLIGYLIKLKSINSIYFFMITKNYLRVRLHSFFNVLRIINRKN